MKHKLLLLFFVYASTHVFSQSQGPNGPISITYSAIGCLSCPGSEWSNYTNITTADGMYAEVSLNTYPSCFQTTCYYSRYLMASYFGFTIPGSATITGIKAEILRMTSTSPNVKDSIIQLFTPGNNLSSNHASPLFWPSTPAAISYGDSIDLWGLTLSPDTVNNIDFGIRIMIRNESTVSGFAPSSIDHVQLTVYYDLSTGTFSQTRTAGDFTIVPNPVTDNVTIRNSGISEIQIFNSTGEKVFSQLETGKPDQVSIDISSFPPGIYFAEVDNGKEKARQKFIVSK